MEVQEGCNRGAAGMQDGCRGMQWDTVDIKQGCSGDAVEMQWDTVDMQQNAVRMQ